MNRIIVFIALIFSFASCQLNRGNTEKKDNSNNSSDVTSTTTSGTMDELEDIEDIRQLYDQIVSGKNDEDLTTSSFSYNCYGEKSGTVTFYSNAEGVQLIEHQRLEASHFEAKDQYFLKDGEPFFIFSDQTSWSFDETAQQENATKDNITEQRYYLLDGALVQCLEKKYMVRSAADDKPSSEEVPNREVECPSVNDLQEEFRLLMQYKDQTEELQCLE